jgi:hypothetical protein
VIGAFYGLAAWSGLTGLTGFSEQFFAVVAGSAEGVLDCARVEIAGLDTQYFILIVQVYIPADDALQLVQKISCMKNVLAVAEIGLKNKDFHNKKFGQ